MWLTDSSNQISFFCTLNLFDIIGLSVETSVKESTNFASTSTAQESDNFAKDTTDASNNEKSSPLRNVHTKFENGYKIDLDVTTVGC